MLGSDPQVCPSAGSATDSLVNRSVNGSPPPWARLFLGSDTSDAFADATLACRAREQGPPRPAGAMSQLIAEGLRAALMFSGFFVNRFAYQSLV